MSSIGRDCVVDTTGAVVPSEHCRPRMIGQTTFVLRPLLCACDDPDIEKYDEGVIISMGEPLQVCRFDKLGRRQLI
eukprot:gene9091-biopygen24